MIGGAAAFAMPAAARDRPVCSARHVLQLAMRPRGVRLTGCVVQGDLRFPASVSGPVALTGVEFKGRVVASSTSFSKLVDFRGSTFDAVADFSGAGFGGAALFRRATFTAPVAFAVAQFGRVGDFGDARFFADAGFGSANFGDIADFARTTFLREAGFGDSEFRLGGDFSAATFLGRATFVSARFLGPTSFFFATFSGNSPGQFSSTRFDRGADFDAALFNGAAVFDGSRSLSDLTFAGANLNRGASFVAAVVTGTASFAHAHAGGRLNFDEASVEELDLEGLAVDRNVRILVPVQRGRLGSLGGLVADPDDIGHIGLLVGDREHALELIRAAAQRADDTNTANRAHLRLRTLKRGDESPPVQALDYVFYWGAAGYFVLWWHPLVVIGALLLLGTALRMWRTADGAWHSFARSFGALWELKVHQGTPVGMLESTVYKIVLAVLLLNLANVWPPVHDVLQGVLP